MKNLALALLVAFSVQVQAEETCCGPKPSKGLLKFETASGYDFGALATGATADVSVTLTNAGSAPAIEMYSYGDSEAFSFKGGAYPGAGGTCSTSLQPKSSCTLIVSFAPVRTGSLSDELIIAYTNGASGEEGEVTAKLRGQAAAPAIVVLNNGPTFDFGVLKVSQVREQSFTASNAGGVAATALSDSQLTAPFSYKGGTFPGTGGTCAAFLAPSASCTVVVAFAPTSRGTFTDTLVLEYYDGVNVQSSARAVSGQAVR